MLHGVSSEESAGQCALPHEPITLVVEEQQPWVHNIYTHYRRVRWAVGVGGTRAGCLEPIETKRPLAPANAIDVTDEDEGVATVDVQQQGAVR